MDEGTETVEKRQTYTVNGNILRSTFQRAGWQDQQPKSQADVDRGQGDTTTAALSWRTRSQKAKALDGWRVEVGKTFPENAKALRVAWALEAMFGSAKPYARVTDRYLSRKLGIPLGKAEAVMSRLEQFGLIVRSSVVVDGKTQRRIWPARADARPASGNLPGSAGRP